MPQIKNLEAQKQALSDIESLLKEIGVINDFLVEQGKYELGTYTISFSVKNPEGNEYPETASEQESTLDTQTPPKTKRTKRGSNIVKHEAPFLCVDKFVVRTHVLRSKQEKVNKVFELSSEYNIFLDDNDMNILDMFKEEL